MPARANVLNTFLRSNCNLGKNRKESLRLYQVKLPLQIVQHIGPAQFLVLNRLFQREVGGVEADQAVAKGPFVDGLFEDGFLREDDKIQIILKICGDF